MKSQEQSYFLQICKIAQRLGSASHQQLKIRNAKQTYKKSDSQDSSDSGPGDAEEQRPVDGLSDDDELIVLSGNKGNHPN